jgi:hypothetical protein
MMGHLGELFDEKKEIENLVTVSLKYLLSIVGKKHLGATGV